MVGQLAPGDEFEQVSINPVARQKLLDAGMITVDANGSSKLTDKGRAVAVAALAGDGAGARTAATPAQDAPGAPDLAGAMAQTAQPPGGAQAPVGALQQVAAAGKDKEKKKGGGGGGGGAKEPEKPAPDKAAAAAAARAATAGRVGLSTTDADALAEAAEGATDPAAAAALITAGLVDAQGRATPAGRQALSALERGDARGYVAATDRVARERERDQARVEAQDRRRQEQQAQAAAQAQARRDAEIAEAATLADDFRAGTRGLSMKEQRQLVRLGLARWEGGRIKVNAPPPTTKAASFAPPAPVRAAARRALEERADTPPSSRAGTAVGIARARDLANGRPQRLRTIRRMKAFFDRHQGTRPTENPVAGSKWEQAQGLWGGAAGYRWARGIVAREKTE
jgi:hypothetical protein